MQSTSVGKQNLASSPDVCYLAKGRSVSGRVSSFVMRTWFSTVSLLSSHRPLFLFHFFSSRNLKIHQKQFCQGHDQDSWKPSRPILQIEHKYYYYCYCILKPAGRGPDKRITSLVSLFSFACFRIPCYIIR